MVTIINFKNYVWGERVRKIANAIDSVSTDVIICVPAVNIKEIADKTRLDVFAQHVDLAEKGRTTGWLIPVAVKEAGASGVLLNHSEHQLNSKELGKLIKECKKVGLKTVVCVSSLIMAKKVRDMRPWAVAYEDSKLISTGRSITGYRTEEVRKFGMLFRDSRVKALCGAGVSNYNDVREAKGLGCHGVLVSSAVMKAKDAAQAVVELLYENR